MKLKLTLMAFLAAVTLGVSAQDYKSSIGLRLDYDEIAASYKTFINQQGAIELNAGVRPSYYGASAFTLAGAYQHHFPIANVEGLYWFVGGGASMSFASYDGSSRFNLGIFPTGGVDYKLKNAPWAFSADLRPTIYLVKGHRGYDAFYPKAGVTARYVF